MQTVGLREANLHFAHYIKLVRNGQEILLTDRGTPVAVIRPVGGNQDPLELRLEELELAGVLKRAVTEKLPLHEPVVCSGPPISETIAEMREERY